MTDYKELPRRFSSRSRSLYLGLLKNVVFGTLLGVIVFFLIFITSIIIVNEVYLTDTATMSRQYEHLEDLERQMQMEPTDDTDQDMAAEWIRNNPYVFLLVYYKSDVSPTVFIPVPDTPDSGYRVSEYIGARIDETVAHDQLVKEATEGGYYRMETAGGEVIVAMHEYTEYYHYSTWGSISIVAAVVTFLLVLVNYVRKIIERIKRFESDVTIVSEIDMGYEIMDEGADEITRLSENVDRMRRRMLDHIKSEQEAREANNELITSISHDIRTPLTVLMGYIEMMKEHETEDAVMQSYIAATENTALRLKQLSEDMFKYSLAFGDTNTMITMEEYDAFTLFEQLLSEHIVLMREMGYDVQTVHDGDAMPDGSVVVTDAQNLMRIVDNIFSNLRKYADPGHPILITMEVKGNKMVLECQNKIKLDTDGAESNGIGLKTCARLASIVADSFKYGREGDYFSCVLTLHFRQKSVLDAEVPDFLIGE